MKSNTYSLFKKIILMTLALNSLGLSLPVRNADAGIIIGTVGVMIFPGEQEVGGGLKILLISAGALSAGLGVADLVDSQSTNSALLGISLIVLDADGSLPSRSLVEAFSRKWPFVDNRETLFALADRVKEKAELLPKGQKLVQFSEKEVRDIFSELSLTSTEISQIVTDLK